MIREGCTLLARDSQVMALARKDLALGDKGLPYEPKITFIAVQKRHKTRFFPENPNDGVGKVHVQLHKVSEKPLVCKL